MSIFTELEQYRPGDAEEASDLGRVRALRTAADAFGRTVPLHITGSALVVHPPSGRVLLRWHVRQSAWLHVGGHVDPGEDDPLVTALREAAEETGLRDLAPWPDPAILHVVVVPVTANDREPAHEHADVRYVLATGTPDEARPENPAALLRWLTIPEAHDLTTEVNMHGSLDRVERLLRSRDR
ncbi:NUDIX domain-containing protein [Dactylosporangium sp. NPDC005555]|uniref:NUDIX hydrolase n=1 Tax=Dactylosporangium sp. NPDC005555 TaxID=3154889 RepID=UPI0033B02CA0